METEVGRLAMRQEGDLWVAYYAASSTMDKALFLGSVRIAFVRTPERKAAFMELMKAAVSDILNEATGGEVTWPHGERPASEN
jgi:hypothetical protein